MERGSGRGRGALPSPNRPASAHRPSSAGSNRRQPPAKLQLTKNLKANSPGSLPVPGMASATGARGATPRERGRRAACARRGWAWPAEAGSGAPAQSASPLGGWGGTSREGIDPNETRLRALPSFPSACSFFLPFDVHPTPQKLGIPRVILQVRVEGHAIRL